MHFFWVNCSSALHLRFLVHNNNLFLLHLYSFHTCILVMHTTMDVSNNINYTLFLTKLKVELPESNLKKAKIEKTFYLARHMND